MMSAKSTETGLAPRLERLTGECGPDCVRDYRGLGKAAQREPDFRVALRRARAMADAQRLTALRLLRNRKELCACELQAALGVSHATVSHHMRVLVEAGLVESERRGKWAYYRLRALGPEGRP